MELPSLESVQSSLRLMLILFALSSCNGNKLNPTTIPRTPTPTLIISPSSIPEVPIMPESYLFTSQGNEQYRYFTSISCPSGEGKDALQPPRTVQTTMKITSVDSQGVRFINSSDYFKDGEELIMQYLCSDNLIATITVGKISLTVDDHNFWSVIVHTFNPPLISFQPLEP